MSKGIEKFLNVSSLEDIVSQTLGDDPEMDEQTQELIKMTDDMSEHYSMVEGKDHAEIMDKIVEETLSHANALVELGFNVEPNRAPRLFEVAATMYEKSISAKNSKRDAQLKAMRLALDQRKLALEEKKLNFEMGVQAPIDGEATLIVEDRNAIINRLLQKNKQKD